MDECLWIMEIRGVEKSLMRVLAFDMAGSDVSLSWRDGTRGYACVDFLFIFLGLAFIPDSEDVLLLMYQCSICTSRI